MISLHSLRVGDVLRRPKSRFIQHVGLYAGGGNVFANDPQKGEGLVPFAEFSQGQVVQVERTALPADLVARRLREKLATARPYSLLTNNCEHSVFDVLLGKASSPQLNTAVGGILLGVAAILIIRAK